MAKPKNQAELVQSFITGAVTGNSGHLLINQDTLYNTEGEEFMPVIRRLGPAGNGKIFLINSITARTYHGMYKYHRELVQDSISDLDKTRSTRIPVSYIPMEIYAKPHNRHPLDQTDVANLVNYKKAVIEDHEDKIVSIGNGTYVPKEYEKPYSNDELVEASKQTIDENRIFCKYLQEEAEESIFEQQVKDIEELVRIPQIMEQAIADGGIDPVQLKRLLATRDRVVQMIDSVEQHISVILSIPGESGATEAPGNPDSHADNPFYDPLHTQ
ncbi:MAG: hypothetical protein HF975_04305 [ANME-2 cluster archaeon]|nr:hypothetical protein [ANME-2 cluster archaeon]